MEWLSPAEMVVVTSHYRNKKKVYKRENPQWNLQPSKEDNIFENLIIKVDRHWYQNKSTMNCSDEEAEDAVAAAEDSDMIPPLGGDGGSGGGPVSGGWMECSIYQNYSASEVLVQGLAGVVNQVGEGIQTIHTMIYIVSGRCGGDGESTEGNAAEVWEDKWDVDQCQQFVCSQAGEGKEMKLGFTNSEMDFLIVGQQWFQETHSKCGGNEERPGEYLQAAEDNQTEAEQTDARSIHSGCWVPGGC